MQLRLPWSTPVTPVRAIDIGGRSLPVKIVRHHGARRYVVRVTSDGLVRITVPRRASVAGALAFAQSQSAWIAREWARRAAAADWGDGTRVWYRGELHAIRCTNGQIACGPALVKLQPAATVRAALTAHWRLEAAAALPPRCVALGAPHGLVPARVVIGDQRSRWGSCSARGSISLNWRLVQMPPEVADYVMLHELVHLEHPDHSRRFWRRVAEVSSGWRSAERWLRTTGSELF